MNMIDEQMRIAIAEACGWKPDKRGLGWLNPHGCYCNLPDYFNDLNAMHEAEKVLVMDFNKPDQWEKYMDELNRLCYPDHEEEPEILGRRYMASCRRQHADAKTKAIAFIKTLNLEPK